jgi:hypothetical protein
LGFFRPIRGHDPGRGERSHEIFSWRALVNKPQRSRASRDSPVIRFLRRSAPAHAGAARQKCHGRTAKREAFSIGF